ncbi:glycosyltransferase [Paenibacillus sp. HJL G12]|uniref:Glycosyltransferase n=1 Tax=Paenibacillus dendrobii TaxID=2691084 RepID=A0A7X3IMD4_9BACL|nr:glycosyltransferase [Paenibacillus dendrobii]MWV46619.1 glycosyltransferase [Paenibacillus dendrobii]
MSNNKICFITCFNDEVLYEESVRYIRSLYIPEGYELELIAIRDAKSLTEGYNRAMKQSDAKFKIYLHQDTFIVNKHFLYDILNIFISHSQLGMMGVIGAKKIPPSGVWWKASERYGKVYDNGREGGMKLFQTSEVQGDYESVEAVDGLILMTQYDLPWREDLFKGWHMYDISQAIEFKKAGYEVGVPNQKESWCIHDCGPLELNGYEEYRLIFLKEYGSIILPKVSILIPAYNRPYYLELALRSAIYQSYPNIEIIICDDSTNNEVERVVEPYLKEYSHIKYYKNPVNLALQNWYKLFDLAEGKYINYLMDDDLFKFNKIEKMVSFLECDPDISLVTSFRERIDENGERLPSTSSTRRLFDSDVCIDGREFGSLMLKQTENLIGEPTTAMFRKEDINKFGHFNENEYCVLNDLATWLSLMKKGKVAYISEALSYFRIHSGQNQRNTKYMVLSIEEWLKLLTSALEDEFFSSKVDYKKSLIRYLQNSLSIIEIYVQNELTDVLEYNKTKEKIEFTLNEIIS